MHFINRENFTYLIKSLVIFLYVFSLIISYYFPTIFRLFLLHIMYLFTFYYWFTHRCEILIVSNYFPTIFLSFNLSFYLFSNYYFYFSYNYFILRVPVFYRSLGICNRQFLFKLYSNLLGLSAKVYFVN